ncbi:MAG: hypothetical protein LBS59_04215 [Puniceicoccales bacterium]|jgi:hypothetical protein|nr:hypothetical protein [Puniceicoccales bacterium]
MKKYFLVASAVLATSFTALAGTLSTKGIPTSAGVIFHLDLEAVEKSKISQVADSEESRGKIKKSIARLFGRASADAPENADISSIGSIADITVAVTTPENGALDPNYVIAPDIVIVRGNFNLEKFDNFAKSRHAATTSVIKNRTFYKLQGRLPWGNPFASFATLIDANTILFAADEAATTAALATLTGNAKSYTAPTPLLSYGRNIGAPFAFFYLNGKILPKQRTDSSAKQMTPLPPNPAHVFLVLGEKAGDIKLRLSATYPTASDQQSVQAFMQMGLAMIQGRIANTNDSDGNPDPKKVKRSARLKSLLDAIKITTSEPNYVSLAFDYSSEKIIQFAKEASAANNP